jgi:hypothetical protein
MVNPVALVVKAVDELYATTELLADEQSSELGELL